MYSYVFDEYRFRLDPRRSSASRTPTFRPVHAAVTRESGSRQAWQVTHVAYETCRGRGASAGTVRSGRPVGWLDSVLDCPRDIVVRIGSTGRRYQTCRAEYDIENILDLYFNNSCRTYWFHQRRIWSSFKVGRGRTKQQFHGGIAESRFFYKKK